MHSTTITNEKDDTESAYGTHPILPVDGLVPNPAAHRGPVGGPVGGPVTQNINQPEPSPLPAAP